MTISFSGLSTGIDTNALVDQLVQVELLPAQRFETRKSNANRRASIISDFITKLKSLKSAAASLDTASEVRAVAARSSDEARVKVTSSGAAQPAVLALRVATLAKAQTTVSGLFLGASPDDPVPGAGSLGIKVGSAATVVLDFLGTESLADVTRRINDEVVGVHAELVNTGAGLHIAVTSEETGTASALTFTEAGTSLGFLGLNTTKVLAQDASFTLNGIAMTRSTNTVADAVAGLTLELLGTHAIADPDTTVAVTRDPVGLETKVKSLVDSFNAVAEGVNAQLTYSGVARGQDTLFGDSTVRALQRAISQMAGASYPHGEDTVTLGKLGIQLGRDGKLTIDSAALAKAVASDPAAIENLIAGPSGLAPAINSLVDQYTRTGTGFLSAKTSSLKNEMRRFDDEIARIQTRASRIGDQLHAQFTALETLMSGFQAQQATLNALFR
jgi:flagellar hook-associated protein 2